MTWVLLLLMVMVAAPADAADEVYREIGPDGQIRYSDRPPHRNARPLQFSTLSGPTSARGKPFYSAEALQAAARFAVRVESPTPGQVLDAADGPAVIAATVMPGLVTGFGLIYHLDGRALTERPVDGLSLLLPPLPAGQYRVGVVLVDPQGRELARSPATAFNVAAP